MPAAARGRARCASCRADLPWLVDADDTDFGDVVERARLPVLVDVWAPWCGPCRAVAPVVEELARERAGRLKVVKVNADAAPGTSSRLGVSGIPTLLLFADGRERARVVGAQPAAALRRWLDENLH
ncbi:MAG TPA: thioredoxin [Geodermatophilus sp.]|nr:thioredoxin [Geodermatophilus sp.]